MEQNVLIVEFALILFIIILMGIMIFSHVRSKILAKKNKEEINKLGNQIEELKKELREYADIKKDSLSLNVEEEPVVEEQPKSIELSEEQNKVFELMENTNENLFITGKAGTGKSYLLKYFRSKTEKKVLYCAPTGIAALNIDGVTLHSAFGFNNLMEDSDIKLSANMFSLLKSIDAIVIDEISMVRVDVFNQVDKILKLVNKSDLPFGGKQMILFGDLFQLPPVAKREETEYFADKYGGVFFFNSPAYENGGFKFKELEGIFRQTDKEFIEILNDIRVGNINREQIASLNKHYVEEVPRMVVQVVPMKKEANRINMENLEKLDEQLYEYKAEILVGDNKLNETDFPCDFDLKLKPGAIIMMINNDPEHKRWVNGTLGIVSELSPTTVKVIINGSEYEISPIPFNKYKCEYDRTEKKLKYVVESSVSQYPLILAYAITIHKSQGMTYQQIACNLESCFAPGQAYVALSRCANYDKLYLTEKINPRSIITNNVVANFYKKITQKNEK